MGAQLRIVRRRIKSVQSTQKITRAMELIASSRIVKAQQRVEQSRPYAEQLTAAMEDVAREHGLVAHPLLAERESPAEVGVLALTSDRGLAGAYSANVLKEAEERARPRSRARGLEPVLYVAGKKGIGYFRFRGVPIEARLAGLQRGARVRRRPRRSDAPLIADFADGAIDELTCAYTDFRSAFTQRRRRSASCRSRREEVTAGRRRSSTAEYLFEPEAEQILDHLLPQYLITKICAAMLESAASENAARRRAMKAATRQRGRTA